MRPCALAAAALSAWLSIIPAQVIEQVLVNVNGEIITRRQLDERVRSVLAQQQGRAIAAADVATNEALRQEAERCGRGWYPTPSTSSWSSSARVSSALP